MQTFGVSIFLLFKKSTSEEGGKGGVGCISPGFSPKKKWNRHKKRMGLIDFIFIPKKLKTERSASQGKGETLVVM